MEKRVDNVASCVPELTLIRLQTLLHHVVEQVIDANSNDVTAARLLVEIGADANAKDRVGEAPHLQRADANVTYPDCIVTDNYPLRCQGQALGSDWTSRDRAPLRHRCYIVCWQGLLTFCFAGG